MELHDQLKVAINVRVLSGMRVEYCNPRWD